MMLLYIFVSIFLTLVECVCYFPSDLRGHNWYTTSNGRITVASDGSTITNFVSPIKSGTTFTITCTTYDNSTDRYISTTNFAVFSTRNNHKAFFCMKFTKLTAVKYIMTYDTDLETTTNSRVVVINNITGTLTSNQACALTSSQPLGTQELLVRSDSVSSSAISCPDSFQFNLTATMETSDCTGSSIYKTNTLTQHVYNYASCVSKQYSTSGIFDCMYSVTSGAYIYLTVFNNDSSVDESTTFRALCYVIWSSGKVVYYTYHPKICQVSQTHLIPEDDGVVVVAINNLSNDIASQIAIGVIFGLLFLVILVLAIILLVFYIRGPRKHKAVRILEPKDEKIKKKKSETIFSNSSTDSPTKDEKEKKKKKKTKKKRKKVKQITDINQNLSLRRTESMMKDRKEKEGNLKWTDYVGINSNANEFAKPAWQIKWEQHRDPFWEKKIIYEGDSETERSSESTASTSRIIMVMPDKEEQERARTLWEKVYRLWFEPRKPVPENRLQEIQKLSNLAKPKHVRFRKEQDKKPIIQHV